MGDGNRFIGGFRDYYSLGVSGVENYVIDTGENFAFGSLFFAFGSLALAGGRAGAGFREVLRFFFACSGEKGVWVVL